MRTPWLDAERSPGETALIVRDERLTRLELARRADALASWLSEAGVRPGHVVSALLQNGACFAALLHAVDRLGAILLPLNLRLSSAELAFILKDARPRILVHGPGPISEQAREAARLAGRLQSSPLPDLVHAEPQAARPQSAGATDDPFLLLYTSGTTGRPKGVVLTHANLAASARASARHLGASPADCWLACLPFYHVGGLSILLRGAAHAHPVLVHQRFDAEAVDHCLEDGSATHVSLVPTMLARLLAQRGARRAPQSLRLVLLGGGPLPDSLLSRARALGFPVAPTYGLTEASSQVATRAPASLAGEASPGLDPLPGLQLRIVAQHGGDAEAGAEGEILVRGPTVMPGYLESPYETRLALRNGWLHTGDAGRLDAQGRLHVVDRRSDLILSGGENVYPAEIEAVLQQHPDILEAAVAGVEDEEFGARPAAWVVARPGCSPTAAELEHFCRLQLAAFKVPTRFSFVGDLPRTASGKLQRYRLWNSRPTSP